MGKQIDWKDIQTPAEVWTKLLDLNPIDPDEVFYEPFRGTGNLFNQVTNKKYWTEYYHEALLYFCRLFSFVSFTCNVWLLLLVFVLTPYLHYPCVPSSNKKYSLTSNVTA